MSEYVPDRWVIIKIKPPESEAWYRVFAGWYGGFANGDSWKMSSGITKAYDRGNYYDIHNTSGSIYKCWKGECGDRSGDTGMSGYMTNVFFNFKQQYDAENIIFEVIDFVPLLEDETPTT